MKIGKLNISWTNKAYQDELQHFDRINGSFFYPIFDENTINLQDKKFNIWAFNNIPELQSVIIRKAEMFSKMKLSIVSRETLKPVSNIPPIAKTLRNPNWYQSQLEWIKQGKIFREVHGEEFIYLMFGITIDSLKQISNMNPIFTEVKTNYDKPLFLLTTEPNKVAYEYVYRGKKYPLTDSQVIHLTDANVTETAEYCGISKIQSLKEACKNIYSSYDTRGFFLRNRGAIGIISNESVIDGNTMPINKDEKELVQDEMKKYGTIKGKFSTIITNAKLRYQAINPSVKDMMIFEEIESDFQRICDAYGMDYNLFATSKNATDVNKKYGERQTYENTIIPEAQEWITAMNDKLCADKSYMIIGTFDHLNVFQENTKERAQSIVLLNNGLATAYQNQAITLQEYQIELQKMGVGKL